VSETSTLPIHRHLGPTSKKAGFPPTATALRSPSRAFVNLRRRRLRSREIGEETAGTGGAGDLSRVGHRRSRWTLRRARQPGDRHPTPSRSTRFVPTPHTPPPPRFAAFASSAKRFLLSTSSFTTVVCGDGIWDENV